MGARTRGREAALQMLYAAEAGGDASADRVIREFWREFPADAEGRVYADDLVRAVLNDRERVDGHLTRASKNWRLERMSRVDRNILRIGAWELLAEGETPRAVILDEAVELAKRYGTEDSGAFVNGVLSRVAEDCGRREPEEK